MKGLYFTSIFVHDITFLRRLNPDFKKIFHRIKQHQSVFNSFSFSNNATNRLFTRERWDKLKKKKFEHTSGWIDVIISPRCAIYTGVI